MQNRNTPKPISVDIPRCLCERVMQRTADAPKLLYSSRRNEYLMFCPSCGLKTYPDVNRQSVIAEWCGVNRDGDEHIKRLWIARYESQQCKK